jgi:hypothetical protein
MGMGVGVATRIGPRTGTEHGSQNSCNHEQGHKHTRKNVPRIHDSGLKWQETHLQVLKCLMSEAKMYGMQTHQHSTTAEKTFGVACARSGSVKNRLLKMHYSNTTR